MKKKHLIVVSVDALVYEDLEYAKNFPMFKKILEEGSLVKRVRTIYPSLTHPVHASIITGNAAGKTGVPCNEIFKAGKKNRPWYNYLNQIKCETIFHAAHDAGLTTAACCWPVTAGKNEVIDYLIPTALNEDMENNEDNPVEVYRKLGATDNVIDIIEKSLEKYGCDLGHPDVDDFLIECAAEVIKKYKPNVLFTHPAYVDSARHRTGLFSSMVNTAIEKTDEWLIKLWNAVCDAGIEDETDLVVLSDHGHLNICRTICPNVLLADEGLLKTNEKGELQSWEAYISSCALSAHVYLSRPDDVTLWDKVYNLLNRLANEKLYGFERVLTREEVQEIYGLDGDFSFVLETDGYTSFKEDCTRPIVRELNVKDYRYGNSTHGHMPEKGLQPPFLAMGPSFQNKVVLEYSSILNFAPTFAKILGVEMSDAEGTAINEIIRK